MIRKTIGTTLAVFCAVLLITAPRAQQSTATQQSAQDRVALYQALLDLTNPWTVMCVAAHPDDEDGTSLIVMRHQYGAHTVSLFSTFGEGGQNAIGPELYEELGAIRARETMAAAEIQGSEPHFLGLKDFGYSKSRDETFQKWGHDEALRRMVLEVRKLRPDVIITNHSVTSNDHGHHQATARLIVEAFDAAADPTRFPEQLKDGVTVWQPQRLFVRARGNQTQADNAAIVTIDPNERDAIRGTIFAEQALAGLQKHATQGPWPKTFAEFTARFRAFSGQGGATGQMPLIRYRLEREAKGANVLPKDSHNFLDRLRLPDNVAKVLAAPTIEGRQLTEFIDDRSRVLSNLLSQAKWRPDSDNEALAKGDLRTPRMVRRFDAALTAAAGLSAKLVTKQGTVSPGSKSSVEFTVSNAGTKPVQVTVLVFGASNRNNYLLTPVTINHTDILPGNTFRKAIGYEVPGSTPVNLPKSEHLYDGQLKGYTATAIANLTIENVRVALSAAVSLDVGPPVDIASISPSPLVIGPDEVGVSSAGADIFPAKFPEVKIQLISYLDQRTNVEVLLGQKNQREQASRKVELLPYQVATLELQMPTPDKAAAAHPRSSSPAETLFVAVRPVGSKENISTVEVPIVRANAHVARNLRVAYIRGFDFSLPNALNALGVESKELSVDEVKTADLSKYTSVIVDNRVYESQPDLIAVNQRLLDYANTGGTLIAFYHKSDEWNPDTRRNRPQLAPYKLILGNERITDENALVTFLEPDHPLLNVPNKLNQDDFKDWIQERGLYYPREWDPQFHALLQSNDPGEAPLKGGLLVADYGKGHYIYSSMVWYRQLRAGVPGAYRMLANMISYGREK